MTKTTERRQYVRIVDNIMLAVQTIEEAEQAQKKLLDAKDANGPTIGQHLKELEDQITIATQSLSDKMPKTTHIISLLNRKLNIIAHHMLRNEINDKHQLTEVSLSASGIGFYYHHPFSSGETIALDLLLSPNPYRIITAAKILTPNTSQQSSQQKPTKIPLRQKSRHYIRAEFVGLCEADQEILIQHILRRQGQILKQKRLASQSILT